MRAPLARQAAVAAALVASVAGCALQSPPSRDDLQRDTLVHTAVPGAFKAGDMTGTLPPATWLATFDDPALSPLVSEALAHNTDLQIAAARVEQATGMLQVASGSLLPSLGIPGTYSGKSGGGGGLNAIFLNA